MKRVEFSIKSDIVDEVTENLKDFGMTYEELSEFIFDYQETIENIKELENTLEEIKTEIKSLGVEKLFNKIYENSDFSVYDAKE